MSTRGTKSLPQNQKFIGKRPMHGCSTRGKGDNCVLIDVDSDNFHDIIIIDVPESVQKRLKKPQIISIDDDEEITDESSSSASKDSGSSSRSCTMPVHSSKFAHQNKKKFSPVTERSPPINLSKLKRTYSGKSGSGNRYGYDSESENDSSDSDSDFELMEGSSGELREQWEKASLKRKCNARSKNQAATSGQRPDSDSINVRNKESKESEFVDAAIAADTNKDKENLYAFDNMNNPMAGSYWSSPEHVACSRECPGAQGTNELAEEDNSAQCARKPPSVDGEDGVSPENAHKHFTSGPAMSNADCADQANSFHEKEWHTVFEPCSYNRQPSFDEQFDYVMEDIVVEDSLNLTTELPGDAEVGSERIPLTNADQELTDYGSCTTPSDGIPGSNEQDKFMPVSSSVLEADSCNVHDGKEKNTLCCDEYSDSASLGEENDMKCGMGAVTSHNDVIIDRQKIKETDEYKRAMNEEWSLRQRELQIQAEEAQRLKRKKKAEKRIMDMERRQRQRLEEMRETQKKDEENRNLKEQFRVQIRNELNHVERTCGDMASLLKKLGIPVGGGFLHSPNEVQAAYKRALLKFHPDRASRTDMRQQVEAEEKFKLISRMRDNFPLVR